MLLIGQFDSPFVRRVAVAMHHYDIEFKHVPWSVWANATEIAQYNPLRRVPVVVLDDGEVLVESAAILDAMDELVDDSRRLVPRTGPVRRAVLRISALATGVADKAVSLLYERVLKKEGRGSDVWIERCVAQIRDTLDALEKERSTRNSAFCFDALSHADIALACSLRFAVEAHRDLSLLAGRPALQAHAEYCEAMPPFERAAQPLHVAL